MIRAGCCRVASLAVRTASSAPSSSTLTTRVSTRPIAMAPTPSRRRSSSLTTSRVDVLGRSRITAASRCARHGPSTRGRSPAPTFRRRSPAGASRRGPSAR
ncbi:hypothetical protein [Ornithinimicrobium kibberense]|uniref:hypothetical protein n=1 Tax=Ornithinimicrobium kibberense TaxID=282060 RepID=UPI00360B9629